MLDSNSSLVWSVGWDQYAPVDLLTAGVIDNVVIPKTFSGCLNSIRRARMYVGGRLLFENPDVALTAHIHKLSTNPDHYEEVEDCKLGSQHGVQIQSSGDLADRGKFQTGTDGWLASANGVSGVNGNVAADRSDQMNRIVGSYSITPVNNNSWEATLLLSDVFPALKHLQLPVKFLKDEVRLEIDWETNFGEVLNYAAMTTDRRTTARSITIANPLLYLDYLTYNEEVEAGLAMATANGISIPYREINLINKQLPSNTTLNNSQDIFLGFQGKLLMKIYVSHRFANQGVAVANPTTPLLGMAYHAFNGRCRSDMGENMKYNLIINDLHIHDAKVDTATQQYSYLSMTAENPIYAFPNSFDFNCIYNRDGGGVGVASDISSSVYEVGGRLLPAGNANGGCSEANIRDGIIGTQAFIGFDLSKYGSAGGLSAGNAGFRVGSTPIILNIEEDGGLVSPANPATRQFLPKQVDVICESIRVLQIRNGMADVMDA